MSINELEKSSLGYSCTPLLHDKIKTFFPKTLSTALKIKAIQFELVTDPIRVEDD